MSMQKGMIIAALLLALTGMDQELPKGYSAAKNNQSDRTPADVLRRRNKQLAKRARRAAHAAKKGQP